MKANIGSMDRTLRLVIGVVVMAAGVYFKTWWGLVGVVPVATALVRWCPLYLPFHIDTGSPKR